MRMTEIQKMIEYLKDSRMLGQLPDELLEQLIPLCSRLNYSPGKTILKESIENSHVFILIKGSVSIYSSGEFIVKLKRRGDIFGEMSVITGNVSTASVISDTPVELLGIRAKNIGRYNLVGSETLENNFFRVFARILSEKLALTTKKARKYEIANRELLKTQKKLEKANEEAVKAIQAKSAFLAMMSHEIRTPLNSIIGNSELLYYTDLNSKQEKHLNTVYRSGQTLLSIINNILDFSAIEVGSLHIEKNLFDLRSLFNEVGEMFSNEFTQKGVDLQIRYDDSVENQYIGDKIRLRQILINLLGNAIKFTTEGYVRLSVEKITADETEDHLLVKVEDTGIGIPVDKHEQIFQEFSQADITTTRRFGGTGLGLAICKKLVMLMGGEIGLNSQEEKGATFQIRLNLMRAI